MSRWLIRQADRVRVQSLAEARHDIGVRIASGRDLIH
jgi:hypothetical protein